MTNSASILINFSSCNILILNNPELSLSYVIRSKSMIRNCNGNDLLRLKSIVKERIRKLSRDSVRLISFFIQL